MRLLSLKGAFNRSVYRAWEVAIDQRAIEHARIAVTLIRSYQITIATGEYGIAARRMVLSNKQPAPGLRVATGRLVLGQFPQQN